jgi:glycogen debranching enzyme
MKNGEWLTLDEIYTRLKSSFETCFYVPLDATMDSAYRIESPALVGRRGIYKDTFGASNTSCDYQLRPNCLSAMVFAPELFNSEHAKKAIALVETYLMGPLGMRTLDPADSNYRPVYSHAESSDYWTSKGFNYHQGPEWLWCYGHFLVAKHHFCGEISRDYLRNHMKHLVSSPYLGLPELTNSDGGYCEASCQSQAWSMATILEAALLIDN